MIQNQPLKSFMHQCPSPLDSLLFERNIILKPDPDIPRKVALFASIKAFSN